MLTRSHAHVASSRVHALAISPGLLQRLPQGRLPLLSTSVQRSSCSASSSSGHSASGDWSQELTTTLQAAALSVALLLSPLAVLPTPPSLAAEATPVSQGAMEEYSSLDSQGKLKGSKALEDFRSKYKIRRTVDGRVQLRGSKGDWYTCRLDMEVAGTMLLRSGSGQVYALQTGSLQQIDLSDDLVVLMMFADGEWEKEIVPIELNDEAGKTKQLELNEKEFREVVGLLREVMDAGEEGRK